MKTITTNNVKNAAIFMENGLKTRDVARDVSRTIRPHAVANGIKMKAPVKGVDGWNVAFSFGETLSLNKA